MDPPSCTRGNWDTSEGVTHFPVPAVFDPPIPLFSFASLLLPSLPIPDAPVDALLHRPLPQEP